MSTTAKNRAWTARPFLWGIATVFCSIGCGGDLPRYPYPGSGFDGGSCVNSAGGYYDCSCTNRPYAVVFSALLDGSAMWSDVDLALLRQDRVTVAGPVTPPAKGTPGANGYLLASLLSSDGVAHATSVVQDPRRQRGDSGVLDRASVFFALGLDAGVTQLRIENWGTGQVLLDLDLRGHLQLLCFDHPCLSICGVGGVDGGSSFDGGAVDGGSDRAVVDSGSDRAAVDGGSDRAAVDGGSDRAAVDGGSDRATVDAGSLDATAADL
jgi:hypothetical protein